MERFVIIVNGFQPLTIITKRTILDVTAVLDLHPMVIMVYNGSNNSQNSGIGKESKSKAISVQIQDIIS